MNERVDERESMEPLNACADLVTVTRVRVGDYEFRVADGTHGTDTDPHGAIGAHSHYALTHPDNAIAVQGFNRLAAAVSVGGGAKSVLEAFGGSGWHTAVIQRAVAPDRHVVFDLYEDCALSTRLTNPGVEARAADSYSELERMPDKSFDWVHMDYNRYTYYRGLKDAALPHAFRIARRWVTIADSAIFGLRFPGNRSCYGRVFGRPINSAEDYLRAASRGYAERFGFSMVAAVGWRSNCAETLMEVGIDARAPVYEKLVPPFWRVEIVGEPERFWRARVEATMEVEGKDGAE